MGVATWLYIAGQLARLNNSLNEASDLPTGSSRYSGGHNRQGQPYITGYHHVLIYPPGIVFSAWGGQIRDAFFTTCETFTPHTYNINMSDVYGMGQVAASYPVSRTTNREFMLGFRERGGLPVLNTIKTWHAIFHPHFGSSPLGNVSLSPMAYKGTIAVAIVKPTSNGGKVTADDIEEAYFYNGVYPTNVSEETVTASDQNTNESAVVNVTFKFDGAPLDCGTLLVREATAALFDKRYDDVYKIIGSM